MAASSRSLATVHPIQLNRQDHVRRIVAQRIAAGGKLPLDIMFETMDDMLRQNNQLAAFSIAAQIAPYVHAKALPVEGDDDPVQFSPKAALANLSDKDLADFERIVSKASNAKAVDVKVK